MVVAFHGHIQLDPRAGYQHPEGDVWQYVFYLDDVLFDGLLCYAHAERCEVVDLERGNTPEAWSAQPSESLPDITPFVLHFEVPSGDFRKASQLGLRVAALGLGDVGATTLTRAPSIEPPPGLRERLRGEQRLRRVYASIAQNYQLLPADQRRLPESHPERPSPPPCRPTWVRDDESVAWLGLSAPVVLSWAFSVEAQPSHGTLRVIARRDRNCRGEMESLVLSARVDEYGDLERIGISSSSAAPGAVEKVGEDRPASGE